jgi:predicted transcriptional regulator YheO
LTRNNNLFNVKKIILTRTAMKKSKNLPNHSSLIESLKIVVDGIAGTFGPHCEVVLHDLSNLGRSIVKIANGRVTGRSVGGSITDQGLKDLRKGTHDLILNYRSVTSQGRALKSTTIVFRDGRGKPTAAICINLDVTDILAFNDQIQGMFGVAETVQAEEQSETFEKDVASTLEKMASKAIGGIGKQIQSLSKDERIDIVRDLDNQGFFLIKGAMKILASKLKLSKFTIYNYLDEIKNRDEIETTKAQQKGRGRKF